MIKKIILVISGSIIILLTTINIIAGPITINEKKSLEKVEKYIEVNSIKNIKEVFNSFIKSISAPSAKGCKDGTYRGESIYDNYKYKHVIEIKIKNEKITSVKYDEVKKNGIGKKNDKKYNLQMKKGSGAAPFEVYPIYQKRLLKTQNLMKIDGISGATYSLYRFRTAAIRALLKAKL